MTPKRFTLQLALAGLIAAPLPLWAAGLGKLTVNSALGQPLAAEIEIYADKAELDGLRAMLANEESYKNARIGMAPVLSSLRFAVSQRGGKPVLKLSSTRPVNDPFVDMLIELSWDSGKMVREYTLLIDPPEYAAAQAAPVAPAVRAPSAAAAKSTGPSAPADRGRVRRGETLGAISRRVRPEGVSLEQTLVGLFRANPKAFDGNNMNRLKSGATLKVPEAARLLATKPAEARREVQLQAEDWRAYRARLADAVAAAEPAPAPDSAAGGKLAPKVVDAAKPAPEAQKDVLSLSKAPPSGAGGELETKLQEQEADAIARENALKESSERIALLEKQIADMQALVEKKEQAAQAALEAKAAAAETEGAWYDPLLANPLYWGGGAALLGLGGLLWWTMAGAGRRKQAAPAFEDSVIRGGNVPVPTHGPTGAGGGNVDTGNTSAFLTDFSQTGLGAIDTHDVDPVAEADVYIAYGRDAQAEDILKDALGKYPDRHEIRMKLLEIYAARRNLAAFEATAGALRAALSEPPGPLWDQVVEMGHALDPENPRYGGAGAAVAAPEAVAEIVAPALDAAQPAAPALDLPTLDLDLSGVTPAADEAPRLETGELAETGSGAFDSKFDFSGLDLDLNAEAGEGEADEVATKLDLARAYVEMGDKDGAREILAEVLNEGSEAQKAAAQTLLDTLA